MLVIGYSILAKYDWDGVLISTSSISNYALIREKWSRKR